MKTATLNQYLTVLADCPRDVASQRHFANHAYHSIAQCLADGGYPARLLQVFPPLKQPRAATRRDLSTWWSSFRAWLRTLAPRELRCLERELILWPEDIAFPSQLAPARSTGKNFSPLREWATVTLPAPPSENCISRAETPASLPRAKRAKCAKSNQSDQSDQSDQSAKFTSALATTEV